MSGDQLRDIRTLPRLPSDGSIVHHSTFSNFEFSYYRVPPWESRDEGTTSSPFAIDFAFTPSPNAVIERIGRAPERRDIPAMSGGAMGGEPFDWLRTRSIAEFVELRPTSKLLAMVTDAYRRDPGQPYNETYGNSEPFLFFLATRLRAHALAGDLLSELEADTLATLAIENTSERDGGVQLKRTGAKLDERRLRRVRELLEDRIDQSLTLQDLADEAAVSRHHFAVMFRRTIGTTPHRYLTSLRMQKAVDLLRSGHTVESVARSVGYAAAHQFRAAFKRQFGTLPSSIELT